MIGLVMKHNQMSMAATLDAAQRADKIGGSLLTA